MVDRRSISSFHRLSAFVMSCGNLKPNPMIAIGSTVSPLLEVALNGTCSAAGVLMANYHSTNRVALEIAVAGSDVTGLEIHTLLSHESVVKLTLVDTM